MDLINSNIELGYKLIDVTHSDYNKREITREEEDAVAREFAYRKITKATVALAFEKAKLLGAFVHPPYHTEIKWSMYVPNIWAVVAMDRLQNRLGYILRISQSHSTMGGDRWEEATPYTVLRSHILNGNMQFPWKILVRFGEQEAPKYSQVVVTASKFNKTTFSP